MKMEKPIITSDMGFAQTICEEAAMYVDPMDANDIADKIVKLVNSKELQNKLIENGRIRLKAFGTAAGRAKQYLDICKNMIDSQRNG
jgi:glycosyltransferase involved in cell wall biosynthesis